MVLALTFSPLLRCFHLSQNLRLSPCVPRQAELNLASQGRFHGVEPRQFSLTLHGSRFRNLRGNTT